MSDADVLVVGGGLAGSVAALATARHDPDATVTLLTSGDSPFDRSTGLIDVLGTAPDGTGPVVDPFERLAALPPDHPYRLLGADALREGLALFDEVTDGEYSGGHTDQNALVPTLLGIPTPAARYPASVEPGLASVEAGTLLVGFENLPDFHAPSAADRLSAAGVPFDVAGATTHAPVPVESEPRAIGFADALEEDARAAYRSLRASLGTRVESVTDDEDRVGLPAVLGFEDAAAVHAAIATEVGAEVFEVPLGPPSVLGRRLESTLRAALDDAGVTHTEGTIAGYDAADDHLTCVRVRSGSAGDGPAEVTPEAVVLATGGPADGGVVADREAVREPRFGCDLDAPDAVEGRASPDPFGTHAFARYGVEIDGAARPLTDEGSPEFRNLFAAGSVLGGHDFVGEKSVGGVALASGYAAGREAAAALGDRSR